LEGGSPLPPQFRLVAKVTFESIAATAPTAASTIYGRESEEPLLNRRLKVFLFVPLALAAVLATFALLERRPLELAWAKASARRAIGKFSPQVRKNLNIIPVQVDLPPLDHDPNLTQAIDLGEYVIRVPRPDSSANQGKSVLLTYSHYQVRILIPRATARADSAAKQFGFKSMFDFESAIHHTRLDDLDAQPDLTSLKRHLMLLMEKVSETYAREQFRCGDLRGFILNPLPGKPRTVIEVDDPSLQAGFGIWITDGGRLSDHELHRFLQLLRVELKRSASATTVNTTVPTSQP